MSREGQQEETLSSMYGHHLTDRLAWLGRGFCWLAHLCGSKRSALASRLLPNKTKNNKPSRRMDTTLKWKLLRLITSGGTFHPDHKTRQLRIYTALDKTLFNIKHLQGLALEQFMASQSAFMTTVSSVIYYYLDFEQN